MTHCPEDFKGWTGVKCEGGVEVDVGDTSFANRGVFDPGFADAEDVGGVARAIKERFADGTTGSAAGVGGSAAADEMGFFPWWKLGECGGECQVGKTSKKEKAVHC